MEYAISTDATMIAAEKLIELSGAYPHGLVDIEPLRAALTASLPHLLAAQWRPIESAPKDGTYICVYPPTWKGVMSCARFDDDKYANRPRPYWNRSDTHRTTDSRDRPPTHWQPLPPPPGESA